MQNEEFYVEQSEFTDPGAHGALYADLPRGLTALREVVQGLLIHLLRAKSLYGVTLPPERKAPILLYHVSDMLAGIVEDDSRPLDVARRPEKRYVATCRTYALLLCSMMRHQGTPARLRNCFATYLKEGVLADHWICECWVAGEGRWTAVDAQMDGAHRKALALDFDPLDVPSEKLYRAGEMWGLCRRGEVDPELCGSMNLWGMDYVKGDVLRDLTALNKREMLPWDGAALAETPYEELSGGELALLDRVAELTAPEVRFSEARQLYLDHPELHAKALPNRHAETYLLDR